MAQALSGGPVRMLTWWRWVAKRSRNACGRAAAGSLADLLRAQIGYADRTQELLLATDLGRVQLLRGRDSLPVFLFERLEFGLPGCFPTRHTPRVQLILVGVVVGPPPQAVAGLAVRPAPTRPAAVDAEVGLRRYDTAARAGSRVARHQPSSGAKTEGFFLTARESGVSLPSTQPLPPPR